MTAWKWSVDGQRVKVTAPKVTRRRAAQCGLSDTSVADVRRAIATAFAAAEDIIPPDLSRFGVVLDVVQQARVAAVLVRVRDTHRARSDTEVAA